MDTKENFLRLKIVRGADNLNIKLTDQQSELLLRYLLLFEKWNKAYNLSAVRNVDQMVSRHLLDSLTVLPHIQSKKNIGCWNRRWSSRYSASYYIS